jgi:hypothetical protein
MVRADFTPGAKRVKLHELTPEAVGFTPPEPPPPNIKGPVQIDPNNPTREQALAALTSCLSRAASRRSRQSQSARQPAHCPGDPLSGIAEVTDHAKRISALRTRVQKRREKEMKTQACKLTNNRPHKTA